MEYVLRTSSICKKYGKNTVLNDLSINVPKGAIYGLVGKNGAGKTTLIRVVCGLQEPTKGEYTLYDCNNKDKNILQSRRRMRAVIETPAIYLNFSARDNIIQQYKLLGLPVDDGVDEILELIGLADTGKKIAKKFSLGMKQRLGIGMVLVGKPDFIVLDEPINGLDPQGIIEIRELLLKLNKEKKMTILLSSHILGELSRVATWYGFIDKGTLVKEISAEKLEESCRKSKQLTVDNVTALIYAFDKSGIEYEVIDDDKVNIFTSIGITRLSDLLKEVNCEILSFRENDETLESYYINLLS